MIAMGTYNHLLCTKLDEEGQQNYMTGFYQKGSLVEVPIPVIKKNKTALDYIECVKPPLKGYSCGRRYKEGGEGMWSFNVSKHKYHHHHHHRFLQWSSLFLVSVGLHALNTNPFVLYSNSG
jgi:hypothetical protein